jgi:hypothetical protein
MAKKNFCVFFAFRLPTVEERGKKQKAKKDFLAVFAFLFLPPTRNGLSIWKTDFSFSVCLCGTARLHIFSWLKKFSC